MAECNDTTFAFIVANSISVAAVLRRLGCAYSSSGYRLVLRRVSELQLSTIHWKGRAHGTSPQARKLTAEDVLIQNSSHSGGIAKRIVLRDRLLPEQCAILGCGQGIAWNGKKLVLRLDHKNGIRNDHCLQNLRFVCPNCDSQLPTFCGRNTERAKNRRAEAFGTCSRCGAASSKRTCRSCAQRTRNAKHPQKTKISWPPYEELVQRFRSAVSVEALARELGVSGNAIRKRVRSRTPEVEGRGL